MLDLKQQVTRCSVSQCQTAMVVVNSSDGGDLLKRCTDCRTTTTPLWRGGPAGPKSLCNACGIKYHKKRRALLGIEKSKVDKTKKKSNSKPTTTITSSGSSSGSSTTNDGGKSNNSLGMPLKIKIMSSGINRQRHNLEREVEQAALLLMTLSNGFGYVYC